MFTFVTTNFKFLILMKKFLLTCMLVLGIGASAQILVNEGFEGSSTPTGWAYTSFSRTTTSPRFCAGAAALSRNFWSSGTTGNIVYTSTASNATAMDVEFKYKTLEYSAGSGVGGDFKVEYSVDNGTTYTQLGSTITVSSIVSCTTWTNSIPAGTIPSGAGFKFRISGTRTAGDYYFIIDDVKLTQQITAAPACTTVSAPANAATGVSITPTISYAASAGTSSYLINLGTTSGGTDVLNNYNNGTSTSYTIPTASALLYNTTYYLTVIPSNSIGSATGCAEITFTTTATVPCPTVSQPAAGATGTSLQPTITWSAVTGATGYYLTVGTTAGGNDVLNNQDLGNVTSYTFSTPLNASTQYFYTLKAYQGANVSSGCSERNFTTGSTPPPANDNCSGATSLTVNPDLACGSVTAGNTLGASQSMAAAPCFGNPNDDVWYSFVATNAQHVVSLSNVTSTGTTTGITDMYMQVLSGSCGSQTSVACSDPDTVNLSGLTIGETYYVRVYTYTATSTASASFNICVGTPPPPPANDSCANAVSITAGATFDQNAVTGTNVSATSTTDTTATHSCQTTGYNEVWYSVVVPASGSITIETKSVSGSSVTDTVLGVYTGSCGALTQVGCDDDSSTDGNFSLVSLTGQTPGATLLIGVWNYSSSTSGQFRVSAYDGSLGTTEIVASANDVKVYPNPFVDILNISNIKDIKNVTVTDMSGRIVKTIANPSRELNLSALKSGMYILKLDYKDGTSKTLKAVKK